MTRIPFCANWSAAGKPEEITEAVLWLCSDASSFVTGLPMPVASGYVAQ
jgi:NAD(P)-dependent dehydrogenase (short-subunit alcohol dehydrogenase family)